MNQPIRVAQFKRVSVLICKNQPIEVAQLKRVSVLTGKHRPIGITQIFHGFFRHFCHLSCLVVKDCYSPLSFVLHFVVMLVWLKANQSVSTLWEVVGVRCDEKGFH